MRDSQANTVMELTTDEYVVLHIGLQHALYYYEKMWYDAERAYEFDSGSKDTIEFWKKRFEDTVALVNKLYEQVL